MLGGGDIQFFGKHRKRLFLTLWVCSLSLFIAWDLSFSPKEVDDHSELDIKDLPTNTVKAFSVIRRDPGNGHRPLYSISAEKMTVDNGQIGLFKTGIFKTANINKLKLRVYSYTDTDQRSANANGDLKSSSAVRKRKSPDTNTAKQSQDNPLGFLRSVFKSQISGHLSGSSQANTFDGDIDLSYGMLDISNVAKVIAEQFDYQLFTDSVSTLRITSIRASNSRDGKKIVLKGHVQISSGDNKVETNEVVWDFDKTLFTVKGKCLLTRNGKRFFGSDITFDENIDVIKNKLNLFEPNKQHALTRQITNHKIKKDISNAH